LPLGFETRGFIRLTFVLRNGVVLSFLGIPTGRFGSAYLVIDRSFSNFLFKTANSNSNLIFISSLLMGAKNPKSDHFLVGAIATTKQVPKAL
jgi:hypothetical protein